MSELRKVDQPYKRVMIAGGGNIGATLAMSIERDYQVKVIEQSYGRCKVLSERSSKVHRAATAAPPTRSCSRRRISSPPTCSAPSPTTMNPIS